jgi:hypothetical protein
VAVLRTIPTGDLALENGDVVVLGLVTDTRVRYIRQKIVTRFKFFYKEWFLDQRQGLPYYRDVFTKTPNLDLIRSLYLRVLRDTPGVLDVVTFSLIYDRAARSVTFTFEAVVEGGEIEVRPEDADFIVNLASAA